MTLSDQDTSVVDGLGQTKLVDAGLQTALQEVLNLQSQHVIELHAGLVQHTDADETANQGIAFEQTLGVLLVEGEKLTARFSVSIHGFVIFFNSRPIFSRREHILPEDRFFAGRARNVPGSSTNLGQGELDTPHLALVAQAVLADNLQFRVTIEEKKQLGTDFTRHKQEHATA